jgi:NAD(P)-dependent dehydrogenase (short-subunit alcohol dehydrogenase family)
VPWFDERSGLAGSVAVVTGGAGGLGASISLDLAANGVEVAVIDIDPAACEAIRRQLDEQGSEPIVHVGDAREPESLAALFRAVDARWGRLDGLVNVVGGTFRASFTDTTPKGWDAILRTNLMHVLHACSLAVPRIRAGGRGGSIVNITTIEAHRAAPGFAVYSAAKAAVEQFARTLAVELAPEGIRVNNVAPDYAPTPNMMKISAADPPGIATEVGVRIRLPMGRAGAVTDVSNAVVFLLSGLSSYITGSTLHPDGGSLASSGWFNWPDSGWNTVPREVIDLIVSQQAGSANSEGSA